MHFRQEVLVCLSAREKALILSHHPHSSHMHFVEPQVKFTNSWIHTWGYHFGVTLLGNKCNSAVSDALKKVWMFRELIVK